MSARPSKKFEDTVTLTANAFGLLLRDKRSCGVALPTEKLLTEFATILAGYLESESCDYQVLSSDPDIIHRFSEYQCINYSRLDIDSLKDHVFLCIDYDSAPYNIKRRLKHKPHIRLSVL